jgi:putative protease
MAEKKIGEVMKYFTKPSVAAVKITEGEVSVGDSLKFSGHTTDFIDVIESMEVVLLIGAIEPFGDRRNGASL